MSPTFVYVTPVAGNRTAKAGRDVTRTLDAQVELIQGGAKTKKTGKGKERYISTGGLQTPSKHPNQERANKKVYAAKVSMTCICHTYEARCV